MGAVVVGALLLGLGLAQSVGPNAACPAAVAPQGLGQPQYQDTAEEDTGSGFMAPLVQSFLQTLQPNSFPDGQMVEGIEQKQPNQELFKEALVYKVGFLVCAAIGILYIVLMPIVGFFLACCRCCGNCGGKMYQKQSSSIHCRRRALYWSAFITTLIILAGNICMFKSNETFKVSIDQSPVELNKSIFNVNTFLNAVPQQINNVVNESNTTVQEVTRNLDAIGAQLGREIQERLRETLDPALRSLRHLAQGTANTSVQLHILNSSLIQLQSSMDRLQANVTAVNQTLFKSNCNFCDSLLPELQKLTLTTTLSASSLNEFQSAVDEFIRTNLNSKIKEVSGKPTNNFKQQLGEIQKQISQVSEEIPLSFLSNALATLDQVQKEIHRFTPEVERPNVTSCLCFSRWGVCLVICCVVLLVVLCNLLGLVLGPLGLRSKADPTKRSCTADCGGTFLMMGAGFSFLFSWLFMLIVLLLFLLGGNVYTLLCQPWNNGQLLKFIDTPGLFPGLEIGPALGLKENINISDVYRDCEENQPLWTTLHLHEVLNLEELLNVSKYTEQIQQQFENTDITLSSTTLLSPEDKDQLRRFSTAVKDVDFTEVMQQISNVSSINLNATAHELDKVAAIQNSSHIEEELRNEARALRQIHTSITSQLVYINSTIKSLRSSVENINGTTEEVLSNMEAAQDFLNTNTTLIVKTESKKFLDCQLAYFTAYADWANLTITQQVGRCGPVAGAVDSAEIILCSQLVESLNAFWFSLGWCLIFFIPSIIFSVKLAKYYRKMKYTDVYDNHIPMNNIPRAQSKFN
uniref:Uncharacterized protein n=1 Tax=Mola mola TaxID=94237 RepID=A0A3Q3WNA7_MOLML